MEALKYSDINRLPQSCIISASSAEEAMHEAAQIAAAAVCSGGSGAPCGKCRDCRKALAGIHPDIVRVSRLGDDKGKQKREISVAQIREIAADAVVLPNEARRKVYIIDEADTMNLSAQNAALKLLEEPPAGAMLLLCTTNADKLLPTVRSRCAELSVNSDNRAAAAEGAMKPAQEYIKLVSKRDLAALCRWCGQNEGMDSASAEELLGCVHTLLTDMLCGRKSSGMERADILRLVGLVERCGAWLRVNVGVKHIFGLLAVDSIV